MDQKGFELFQASVQWVWDEHMRKARGESEPNGLEHEQGLWIGGRVAEKIKALWGSNQREVLLVCPTACCLGGNITALNGDRFVAIDEWDLGDYTTGVEHCIDDKNEVYAIQTRARDLVGIDHVEASELFEGGNTATDIVEIATRVAKRHGFELEVI